MTRGSPETASTLGIPSSLLKAKNGFVSPARLTKTASMNKGLVHAKTTSSSTSWGLRGSNSISSTSTLLARAERSSMGRIWRDGSDASSEAAKEEAMTVSGKQVTRGSCRSR